MEIRPLPLNISFNAFSSRMNQLVILDVRPFFEFNLNHIKGAINVSYSKILKRRLQNKKICIKDFFRHSCDLNLEHLTEIVLYDEKKHDSLNDQSFISLLYERLLPVTTKVYLLDGKFSQFATQYPELCDHSIRCHTVMTSLSQPCLSIRNLGPTRILPFMYLGSQQDALDKDIMNVYNIQYILNVSVNCSRPNFIQESHFLQIPINDNYSEKILPYFDHAFQFLDKVSESGGCCLVHCLAGISRSATIAIGYVMKQLHLSFEEARRYVKEKRPSICPNFNFLGQLLEYESELRNKNMLHNPSLSNTTAEELKEKTPSTFQSVICNNIIPTIAIKWKKSTSSNGKDNIPAQSENQVLPEQHKNLHMNQIHKTFQYEVETNNNIWNRCSRSNSSDTCCFSSDFSDNDSFESQNSCRTTNNNVLDYDIDEGLPDSPVGSPNNIEIRSNLKKLHISNKDSAYFSLNELS